MSTREALPQRIAGGRVTLRRAPEVGDAICYEIRRRGTRDAVGEAAINLAGEVPVIERFCIDEEARGYGAGSEAATALLRSLRQRYGAVRAWAPHDRGLAVYFWVRMGFRPVAGEGPHGGLWFEQHLR